MEILEWTSQVKPISLHWEGPENVSFMTTLKNKIVSRAPVSVKSFHCSSLYVRAYGGDCSHLIEELKCHGYSWISELQEQNKMATLNHKRQGECNYYNRQQRQSNDQK